MSKLCTDTFEKKNHRFHLLLLNVQIKNDKKTMLTVVKYDKYHVT